MLPELSLWKCQRWNPPIQWCTNSSECFPSRRRLPNVTGAIVIALKTQKKPTNCAPSADGNVTRHQTLHHPKLYIKQFFIKSFHTKSKWHKSRQVKTQRMEGKKKKKKKLRRQKKNQTVDWRDGEMIDFLGLCSYPDTLSLPYNHNSSHRHIGRAICVRISRQIRWCWITASNHTTLPQHQIVSPFYLWITWASTQIYKWFGGLYAERTSRW